MLRSLENLLQAYKDRVDGAIKRLGYEDMAAYGCFEKEECMATYKASLGTEISDTTTIEDAREDFLKFTSNEDKCDSRWADTVAKSLGREGGFLVETVQGYCNRAYTIDNLLNAFETAYIDVEFKRLNNISREKSKSRSASMASPTGGEDEGGIDVDSILLTGVGPTFTPRREASMVKLLRATDDEPEGFKLERRRSSSTELYDGDDTVRKEGYRR